MATREDVLDLIRHLKQERLFVNAEKEQLLRLNEVVVKAAERLYHSTWIAQRQHLSVQTFVAGTERPHSCQNLNQIAGATFTDAYKHMSYHEQKFSEFLRSLIENPKILAQALVIGDQLHINLNGVVHSMLGSLYANCILQEDERSVLKLLRYLIEKQVATSDDPLRLLRRGSCAFSKLYKIFCEGLFSAKLFLTAALHQPMMRLLMEDDWFYDMDPDKALVRFPPHERLVHFGHPGSKEYDQNLVKYREMTINKLVEFTERFIQSIKNSMYCFPQSLSWIVQQLYQCVTRAHKVGETESRALCAQLLFTMFMCPAICDPEQFGITSDVCISYIARHNLMQVAQILQMLALARADEIDTKLRDLFSKFDKDCMSSLLSAILNSQVSDEPPRPHIQLQGVTRSAILITMPDLRQLVNFLQTTSAEMDENAVERKLLSSLLSSLPQSLVQLSGATTGDGSGSTPNHTPPGTPSHPAVSAAKKKVVPQDRLKPPPVGAGGASSGASCDDDVDNVGSEADHNGGASVHEDVLVIPIHDVNTYPGMMSETKVLDQENIQTGSKDEETEAGSGVALLAGQGSSFHNGEEVIEKRTRFSLSHDQDSIGNASDNVELVSEACSSHSVGSAELDNEADNLSDMLSANVSGRGSPSTSGRDTPLSQNEADDGDQNGEPEPPSRRTVPDLPVTAHKPNRVDVTERFGKFEIRNYVERDEAKSTVSDTWSTDVLASDSEPPEQNQLDRLEEVTEEMVRPGLLGVSFAETTEVSETASDAWSTDVLASDTDEKQSERLLELDQDDQLSISSKSQCTDDQDAQEFGEDTPQASGVQSPADTSLEFGAIGGAIPIEPRELLAYQERTKARRVKAPCRPDRFSEPVERRPAYEALYTERSTFPGFEEVGAGLVQRTGAKAQRRRSHESQNYKRVVIAEQSPEMAGDHIFLPLPEVSSSSSSSNTSSHHHRQERDSGISETPQDESRDEAAALGSLSEKLAQVNLDRSGAMAADLSMFDPLMAASDSDDERKNSELNNSANITGTIVPIRHEGEKVEDRGIERKKSSIFKAFKDRWSKGGRKHAKSAGEREEATWTERGSTEAVKSLSVSLDRASNNDDRGEDILSKYRRKPAPSLTSPSRRETVAIDDALVDVRATNNDDVTPAYDINNLESCHAFANAKRKLRLVFSSADFQTLPWSYTCSRRLSQAVLNGKDLEKKENDLVSLLRMQLAEAMNLQDKDLIAQLHETIRCVRMFNHEGTKKLLKSLKDDYKSRAPYISYLVQCRQRLLSTHAHLERLLLRTEKDQEVCNKYLVSMCVRLFLEKREGAIINLVPEFTKLTAADEKTDLLEKFLDKLYIRMTTDPMWRGATEAQVVEGRLAIERSIMSRLYFHAMFPNGDGDTLRDKILTQHIATLSETLTPTHPSLCIPKVYHSECPWPSAQAEIFMINAYKTPKDKLTCVLSTAAIIMNLLSMANDKSVPAADDFMPVLIFVIIKANPAHLLSTVQYINSLYEKRFTGEEQYWWMQFSSAVEFIKTM